MSELTQYQTYKKKLQGICDEHDLVYRLRVDTYPISLTIRPATDVESQMSMLEDVEEKGYISPDAYLVFSLRDGNIIYKTSSTFTIGEALFNKLKNLFKNLYICWLQFFFRDIVEGGKLRMRDMPVASDDLEDTLPDDEAPDVSDTDVGEDLFPEEEDD